MSRLHKIIVSNDKKKHPNSVIVKVHIKPNLMEVAHTCKFTEKAPIYLLS